MAEGDKIVSKKRTNLSILDKLKILQEAESESISSVSKKYNISDRTIRNWRINRLKLEEQKNKYDLTENVKRIRVTSLDTLEDALHYWFEACVKNGIPMTGPLIQAKALELHEEMKLERQFNASAGWLHQWKKKFCIKQYNICGEKLSADTSGASVFKHKFAKEIEEEDYQLCQIFNADETGLNFKAMPKKTLASKSLDNPAGLKQNKDRVTVMSCSNADGSLKLPLVVIGKSAKPRALKGISKNSLPVYYSHQKSAWMSQFIFDEWFTSEFVPRVTDFLKSKDLPIKAVLLLDNANCHPKDVAVGDIRIQYLPANTTSIIQPMDQGIIENIKRKYKTSFLRSILLAQKNNIDIVTHLKTINIKCVIDWISQAWDSVSETTIFKCWKNVLPSHYYNKDIPDNSDSITTNVQLLNDVQAINMYNDVEEAAIQNWIEEGDGEQFPIPSNAELIALVAENNEDENIDADKDELEIPPTDVVSAADILLNFCQKNNLVSRSELSVLLKIKQEVVNFAIDNPP